MSLPRETYETREQRADFYGRLFPRLQALPGVRAVGINHALPFGGVMTGTRVNAHDSTESLTASWQAVSPDYFRAMTIPVLQGRTFDERELIGTMRSAVINRLLAERLWGDQDPVGRRLLLSGNPEPLAVVGVVGATRDGGLDRSGSLAVYLPVLPRGGTIVMLADSDPTPLVAAIRTALANVDPVVAPSDIRLMDERIVRWYAVQRFTALLLGVFAAVAAFLGAVGLYGVVSLRSAGERARLASGARWGPSGSKSRALSRQGFGLVAAGTVIGLAGAFGLTRLLAGLLFQVTPTDAATFVFVSIGMMIVALVACLVPARRAIRLDPVAALRDE